MPAKEWNRAEFDCWIIISGVNKSGKSTLARQLAVGIARQNVRVFVQDPHYDFEGIAPLYESIEAWRSAASNVAGYQDFPLIARFPTADADEILKLAEDSARATGGKVPSLAVINESIMVKGANRYRLGDDYGKMITNRRHYAVGAIVITQFPSMIHYANLALFTDMYLFFHDSQEQIKTLHKYGVPLAICRALPQLKVGQYIKHTKGMHIPKESDSESDSESPEETEDTNLAQPQFDESEDNEESETTQKPRVKETENE